MKGIIILSAVCMQLGWISAYPSAQQGVGAYAYQDSAGNRALGNHLEHQRLALNSAHKAFDLTSNRAGYIPNFPFRFQHYSMPDFSAPSLNMANYGPNSAFASGAAGPGYRHQMAAINPGNPNIPNVDVVNFSDMQEPGKPGFYSVSSKSYSSSSNVNGQEKTNRGAETMVNDNGKITSYKVRN